MIVFAVLFPSISNAEGTISLNELLQLSYKNNPGVQEKHYEWSAEHSLIASQATLDNPMVGVSELNRGLKTQYGTISQKIKFPTKYIYQAKAQQSKADSFRSRLNEKKFEVRQQVITLYYAIYSAQKVIQLTKANIESVNEFARVAEKKYSAGKSPQGDSMKAHFELTQLELNLIRLKQEEQALQDQLKSVVNSPSLKNIEISQLELSPPKFFKEKIQGDNSKLLNQLKENSPVLRAENYKLKETEYKSTLAKWEFAPDFQIQYQQRISGEPIDSNILTIGVTIPLWFWKTGYEASAASAKKMAQEYKVKDTKLKLIADIKDLKGRVSTGVKTLEIYQTSLIPQAQGSYNSSRSAYQADKTSFLDLLDSERSLYRVKTDYYQSLRQYVSALCILERELGFSVSNLDSVSEVKNEK